jgi:hypothetical protein
MDYITIIVVIAAALGFIGLAWVGGFELGQASGIAAERELADRRVRGALASKVKHVVDYENARKPKSQRAKRKASRKAVRA